MTSSSTSIVPAERSAARRIRSGFSLVEILVVVALLSVIILGLMAMFVQTQRAFRIGMSQTDILESGRMATELIAREMGQITPCYLRNYNTANYGASGAPNFLTQTRFDFAQSLIGSTPVASRTNILSDVFFLVRQNQTWTGVGYFVRTNLDIDAGIGAVGILYRFETNNTIAEYQQNPGGMFAAFLIARGSTNYNFRCSKILDGVVNFRVRPFDMSGWMFTNNPSWWTNAIWPVNGVVNANSSLPAMLLSTNLLVTPGSYPQTYDPVDYLFYSNAVPAAVELEVGILERQALEHYQSIPVDPAQVNYLTAQAGHVHLFRQRIPVRNVDPSAY